MAVAAVEQRAPVRTAPELFAIAIFVSAALVFMFEPMIAKMILPELGGSPTVWNTAMAFFQAALLAGYGYAHLLQRLAPPRVQALIHLLVLAIAALFLPVHVTGALGPPSVDEPALWLLGVLTVSEACRSPRGVQRPRCCKPGLRAAMRRTPRTPMSCTPRATWAACWR